MKDYQIGIYEKAFPEECTFHEMMNFSKFSGYDFFEISIDRSETKIERLYNQDFQKELKSAITNSNFQLGSMCLSAVGTYTLGSEDLATEERAIDIFKHAIVFALKFGLRIVQIPACDVPKLGNHTAKTDKRYIDNLREIIQYTSANGIFVGLENMEDEYMDCVSKCMRLIREINSPFFQLYCDAGNITSASKIYGTNPIDDFNSGLNHHIAFHLKETRPNKYGGLFYGEGHVDFQSLVSAAWKLGVRRFVLEYWYTGNSNWKNDLIIARQLCEKWIQNAKDEGNSYVII